MIRLAAPLLVVALASTNYAQDDPKKVMEAFQGEWRFVSFIRDGEADSKEELARSRFVVAGDKMTVTRAGKDEPVRFTLDPKALPAAIDLKVKDGGKELVIKGIY